MKNQLIVTLIIVIALSGIYLIFNPMGVFDLIIK